MIGHPKSNSLLGNYLELNGYLRLMDFAEDNNIDENDKSSAYLNWQKALMNGTFRDDLPFQENNFREQLNLGIEELQKLPKR